MNRPDVIICQDANDLCHNAAAEFVRLAKQSQRDCGRFAVALSGGSTPRSLYALLGTAEYKEQIFWPQVHLFWGDERCVPPDHADSNYRMVRESLLSNIQIPGANVHRMAGEKEPQAAAAEYEEKLRAFFHLAPGAFPRFDLILLGMGDDGHTASLFPGNDALNEMKRLVVAPYVEKFNSHRLTLTLPVLNHGATVLFLITGANKAAVVKEILTGGSDSSRFPAALVQPSDGRLVWLITEDAAPK
jgi:6-phosphogluconolactonase